MGIQLDGIAVIAIIMVVIFAMVYDPMSITYVIIAIGLLWCLASSKPKNIGKPVTIPDAHPVAPEEHVEEPKKPVIADDKMTQMSEANLYSLDQVYGHRYAGSVDNRIVEHNKRIGDRDRQATINQIKGRRNNVYEPYYRQELSEIGSKRWWDNDTVISRKAVDNWMDLIMTGRHAREGDNPCPTDCHIPEER